MESLFSWAAEEGISTDPGAGGAGGGGGAAWCLCRQYRPRPLDQAGSGDGGSRWSVNLPLECDAPRYPDRRREPFPLARRFRSCRRPRPLALTFSVSCPPTGPPPQTCDRCDRLRRSSVGGRLASRNGALGMAAHERHHRWPGSRPKPARASQPPGTDAPLPPAALPLPPHPSPFPVLSPYPKMRLVIRRPLRRCPSPRRDAHADPRLGPRPNCPRLRYVSRIGIPVAACTALPHTKTEAEQG